MDQTVIVVVLACLGLSLLALGTALAAWSKAEEALDYLREQDAEAAASDATF